MSKTVEYLQNKKQQKKQYDAGAGPYTSISFKIT